MKISVIFAVVFILFLFISTTGFAQDLIIYPAQGQSEEQRPHAAASALSSSPPPEGRASSEKNAHRAVMAP